MFCFFRESVNPKEFGLQAAAASAAPASVRRRAALHFQLISRLRLAIGMGKNKTKKNNKNKGNKKFPQSLERMIVRCGSMEGLSQNDVQKRV